MTTPLPSDDFVRQLTGCQDRLYAYIRTLVPQTDAAKEILQETSVVLLRKAHELQPGQEFIAWAFRVAFYEVLSYRRNRARDRLIFSEEVLQGLSSEVERRARDPRLTDAVEECLNHLKPHQRTLIAARYEEGASIEQLASRLERPLGTIAKRLYHIRLALKDCIGRKLTREGER